MAKISPVSIKYMIRAKFSAQGVVEKPDVIGAIFGQTEGLLGEDLEMRELQKEGKIGRIEVNIETKNGRTEGFIEVPSALDKSETTIIAAAMETIERIGPTDSEIKIEKIEDIRGTKRDFIVERAKALMSSLSGGTDTREMDDAVKESVKLAKLQEYGTERLPAGDLSGNEIIIVEGRADVVNLLKNNVANVVGMNGAIMPETIKEIVAGKEATLFIDGDRGGKLIAKNVTDNAKITYVASAPDGKEVEELTGKEILQSLRKKVPVSEFFKESNSYREKTYERSYGQERSYNNYKPRYDSYESAPAANKLKEKAELDDKEKERLSEVMVEIEGTKSAVLLDNKLEVIREVSTKDVNSALRRSRKEVYAIVVDGGVTSSGIRACEEFGVKHLAAKNFATDTETLVNLVSV